ncbi:DNA-processing protein DprA [Listeria ivanovii]|uniref:DNA-protecting protein DprA n=2 Tax=Listeria ivanovii TaxID=1638 RepID=A0ABS1G496_LISIV|nr:DNA-processing protein DprA [Listeria ivanovii]EFR97120.1 DNA protecting protein DprA [Listeria ivanovii FSL F6-596]AIS59671.1 Smf family DNA processing protein [Listeria ivanovii subsp. londoniensis]AIS62505.1 Smf family DNA processing protein [Listeria ivanovii subsp. londoniensis]MBK1961683.1 DNA-protecting protein DprA [Listeria ivanovii subsp. londoniensis]MBK1965029.1 DNA-protecting protein DprA [Listeria ivanovii subsp. londoniensis]
MNFKERIAWLKIASCQSISAKKRAEIWQNLSDFDHWEMQTEEFVAHFFNEDKASQVIGELECAEVFSDDEITIIYILDDNYPPLLKEIYEAPPLLFCKGNINLFQEQAIAVVGTRRMSDYGRKACKTIVGELAHQSLTIVSGLANGIDTEAHMASLGINKNTIAVLGSGIKNIYPKKNTLLAEEISQKGLLISEYLPNEAARRWYFPERNRIISGLALGTVIIEAAERSGSLITADFALEQNRQVFAVPGNIFIDTWRGTNNLIQEGAKLVTNGNNIIEEFFQISH